MGIYTTMHLFSVRKERIFPQILVVASNRSNNYLSSAYITYVQERLIRTDLKSISEGASSSEEEEERGVGATVKSPPPLHSFRLLKSAAAAASAESSLVHIEMAS